MCGPSKLIAEMIVDQSSENGKGEYSSAFGCSSCSDDFNNSEDEASKKNVDKVILHYLQTIDKKTTKAISYFISGALSIEVVDYNM